MLSEWWNLSIPKTKQNIGTDSNCIRQVQFESYKNNTNLSMMICWHYRTNNHRPLIFVFQAGVNVVSFLPFSNDDLCGLSIYFRIFIHVYIMISISTENEFKVSTIINLTSNQLLSFILSHSPEDVLMRVELTYIDWKKK